MLLLYHYHYHACPSDCLLFSVCLSISLSLHFSISACLSLTVSLPLSPCIVLSISSYVSPRLPHFSLSLYAYVSGLRGPFETIRLPACFSPSAYVCLSLCLSVDLSAVDPRFRYGGNEGGID